MRKLMNEFQERRVKIDTAAMLKVIQTCGTANLNTLEEYVKTNLDKEWFEAALGLRVLYEIKQEMPLETKWEPTIQMNRVVIPSSVDFKKYVDKAIDYFSQNFNVQMVLNPIKKK